MQLKRRHDLIPNLVQVVKDAMGYEQETLTKVVQARNAAVAASGRPRPAPAEAALTQATRGLFALVESYPQLKANDNVKQLQEELTTTENKISNTLKVDDNITITILRTSSPGLLAKGSPGRSAAPRPASASIHSIFAPARQ